MVLMKSLSKPKSYALCSGFCLLTGVLFWAFSGASAGGAAALTWPLAVFADSTLAVFHLRGRAWRRAFVGAAAHAAVPLAFGWFSPAAVAVAAAVGALYMLSAEFFFMLAEGRYRKRMPV